MTSLNNTLRDQIIDSVIQKGTTIPARKDKLRLKTEKRVREIELSCVPKEFSAATKNLPQEWFPLAGSTQIKPTANPISWVTMTDDEIRSSWRSQVTYDPFRHPVNTSFSRPDLQEAGWDYSDSRNPVKKPENMNSWETKLADLITEAKQIREDEEKARKELRAFLYSVKTYKQVMEKMPELEHHLPNYTKPMPLTVSVAPILKTLSKLGFDQTEKAKP